MATSTTAFIQALACAGAVAAAAPASAVITWSVIDLNPTGYSAANGVSGNKQFGEVDSEAALWSGTSGSWVNLAPAGSNQSVGWGIDGNQQVGFAAFPDQLRRASLWTGTAASWTNLHPIGAGSSEALAVNGGQQAGFAFVGNDPKASLWAGTAASWVNLNPSGAVGSIANAVHNGQQAGVAYFDGVIHAGYWTSSAASWVDLHPAGSTGSGVFGVFNGRQAGSANISGMQRASLWSGSAESRVDLHPAGASSSRVTSIYGEWQVGTATISNQLRAGIWNETAASWIDLGAFLPPHYQGPVSKSVWSDGSYIYVAGSAQYGGDTHAILWKGLIPAPSAMCVLCMMGLLNARRRKRPVDGASFELGLNRLSMAR